MRADKMMKRDATVSVLNSKTEADAAVRFFVRASAQESSTLLELLCLEKTNLTNKQKTLEINTSHK